jgi:hypothetical protein
VRACDAKLCVRPIWYAPTGESFGQRNCFASLALIQTSKNCSRRGIAHGFTRTDEPEPNILWHEAIEEREEIDHGS